MEHWQYHSLPPFPKLIRVFGSPGLHRFDGFEAGDVRLGWTVCGLLFKWGGSRWDWAHDKADHHLRCSRCWP